MEENSELTKIERELVLNYLRDDNVPVTISLEEKPNANDSQILGDSAPFPLEDERIPSASIFPVAIPSEQIQVLDQGIILLKNGVRSIQPFLGKMVRVQFYFNHLGLYFITQMKQYSQGLAIVVPQSIYRIKDVNPESKYSFTGSIGFSSKDGEEVSYSVLPHPYYNIFQQPKWGNIAFENQKQAKALLEEYIAMGKRADSDYSLGNGIHLLSICRYMTDSPLVLNESVEGRKKPLSVIYADNTRFVFADTSNTSGMEPGTDYDFYLDFSLRNNKVLKRKVKGKLSVEVIYGDTEEKRGQCIVCSLKDLCPEDSRYLYEGFSGKFFDIE